LSYSPEQVKVWEKFDEAHSALTSPSTVEAAREADLRRFAFAPKVPIEPAGGQQQSPALNTITRLGQQAAVSHQVPDLARFYNFPPDLNGSGQTIGIIELGGGYRDIDLDHYFQALHVKRPHVSFVSVDGAGNSPSDALSADGQVKADVEIIGAVAPGAEIVVYFAPGLNGLAAASSRSRCRRLVSNTLEPGVSAVPQADASQASQEYEGPREIAAVHGAHKREHIPALVAAMAAPESIRVKPCEALKRKHEDNGRIRFLDQNGAHDEEKRLRTVIEARYSCHLPEFEIAAHGYEAERAIQPHLGSSRHIRSACDYP